MLSHTLTKGKIKGAFQNKQKKENGALAPTLRHRRIPNFGETNGELFGEINGESNSPLGVSERTILRGAIALVTGVDINAGLYQEAQGILLLLRCARPFLRRARLHRPCDEEVQGPGPVGRAGKETVREQRLYPLHPCGDIGRKESIDQEAHRPDNPPV